MQKKIKILVGILSAIVLLFILDLICIFTIDRPLLAIETENSGSPNRVYRGLIYDTYACAEYSVPQIKMKGSKFTCSTSRVNLGNVVQIIDKTKTMKDFACAEALESFYEDDTYEYFYSCIKSKYIVVKYESGYEETVENALRYGSITISDLDEHDIDYIRYEKDN